MSDDVLADSLHPAEGGAAPKVKPMPKGDVRVASWMALIGGAIVVIWYLGIAISGGVYLTDLATVLQYSIWGLAILAFTCGIISLNARRSRGFASAGFIAGVVSLLVSLTIGLPAGLQIVF